MVQHNFAYPLGHIITAKYWQNVEDNGLHLHFPILGGQKPSGVKSMGNGYAVVLFLYMTSITDLSRLNLCI